MSRPTHIRSAALFGLVLVLCSCSNPDDVRYKDGGASAAEAGAIASEANDSRLPHAADSSAATRDAEPIALRDASFSADAGPGDTARGVDAPGAPDNGTTPPNGSSTPDASEPGASTPPQPTACMVPTLPPASQLTAQAKHPDPFKQLDGTRITRKDQWTCRRAEIAAQLKEYESGPKPDVSPEDVRATWSGSTLNVSISREGKTVQFSLPITRPSNVGSAAVPLVISYTFMTLDETVFTQNGVATAIFSHDRLGAQSGAGSRGTGLFYDLYGKDHPASSMVAWAWGVSRILDALEKTPAAGIDVKRVAVTGCSRYGKGALLAGALDERIALTIPQESGAGGSASWRVSQAQSGMGVNVQTLSNAAGEQPWFRANFSANFGGSNVSKLPFDHHMVMGLVAPRPLLVIDNAIDWLGIDSSFTAGSIAHSIWEALGVGDRMGYSQSSSHTHCQFPAAQRAVLEAYVKTYLVGNAAGSTRVLQAASAKVDLHAWMDWSVPTLQ